jgi:hypothetical protein
MKQRAVTEFLIAENVTPAEIHCHLQAVYGENTVNRTTVNRWAIKFRECEQGRANIVDKPCSGRPVSVFWDSQRVYMTEFLEAGNAVNSAQYIETIKNLQRRVCRVRWSIPPILLLHDNARLRTAHTRIDALETLKFEVLSCPPYCPDLAQAISISFLTSRGISRRLISPQMMK